MILNSLECQLTSSGMTVRGSGHFNLCFFSFHYATSYIMLSDFVSVMSQNSAFLLESHPLDAALWINLFHSPVKLLLI